MRVRIGLLGRWAAPVVAAMLLYYPNSPVAYAWRSIEMLLFLVLIAYDPDQYYPAMGAVLHADADGRLDRRMLYRSAGRLDRMLAWLGRRSAPASDGSAFTTGFKVVS